MATFMEESGVEKQNRHLSRADGLQLQAKGLSPRQSSFVSIQLIASDMRNSLSERDRPINNWNVYSPKTAVDNFIKIGGDAAEERVD